MGERQAKGNEKNQCLKGWETLDSNFKKHLIMTLRNTKRIINYCVLIIGFAVWGSCNSKSQHVLLLVDNVRTLSMFQ